MKPLFAFFVCLFIFVPLVRSSSCCDYGIGSISDLTNVLNGQQDWTFVPILCFWAGYYNFSGTPLYLTASQKWIGPQKGVDASCGREVSPPCDRLNSASSLNASSEAILNILGIPILVAINHNYDVNFTLDGFTIYQPSFGPPIIQQSDGNVYTYIYNSYVYNTQVVSTYVEINSSYVGTTIAGQSFFSAVVSLATITNNYFDKITVTNSGTSNVTVVDNTFAFVNTAFVILYPSYFEGNIFLYSQQECIVDISGESVFIRNLFYLTSTAVYFPFNGQANINFIQNCFIENFGAAINLGNLIASNSSIFSTNYFGSRLGPSIVSQNYPSIHSGSVFFPYIRSNGITTFNFNYSATPVTSFTSPNVCPHAPIFLKVQPSSFDFVDSGVTISVNYSLYLDPLLISAGLSLGFFDGLQGVFYLYDQYGVVTNNDDPLTELITFNPSISTTGFFNVSIDLENLPLSQSPNYYIVVRFIVGPNAAPSYQPYFWTPITINYQPPLACNDPPKITVQKIQRFNGPLHFNLNNLYCSTEDWKITGVLNSTIFIFNETTQDVQLNIPSNASGKYVLYYTITPLVRPLPVQTLSITFSIVNHNPVIIDLNYTYVSPINTSLPLWNIISNSTDQDGDILSVVQIQRTKARNSTSVVQLTALSLYFVPEKVVVTVSTNGDIQLSQPNLNTNPVSAGGPLPSTWKKDISFQVQITDGDIEDQFAWGIVNISNQN